MQLRFVYLFLRKKPAKNAKNVIPTFGSTLKTQSKKEDIMLMDNPFATIDRRFNRLESLLEKIAEQQELKNNANNTKSLLSRKEASKYLDISYPTLRKLTASGQLPCVYIGDSPKYKLEDLDQFIENQK